MTSPDPGSEGTPNPGSNDAPAWARDAITKANSEAAGYRVKLNDTTSQLNETLNKYSALETEKATLAQERDSKALDLLKLQTAIGVGIPGESAAVFAARLNGTDEATLKADAEELKKIFGTPGAPPQNRPPTDPSQSAGRGANTPNDSNLGPSDSLAEFLRAKMPSRFGIDD